MREALITKKGWNHEELPCEKTISNILNRLGFRLRRVQKAKPSKKFQKQMPSSTTSTRSTRHQTGVRFVTHIDRHQGQSGSV